MTVWEKTLVNLQKGHDKLMSFAATFSERVKAEITIIRLKIQISEMRDRVGEQHRIIGRKLIELKDSDGLPASFELFFKSAEITSVLERLERAQKDLEILLDDLNHAADGLKHPPAGDDERSA